MCNSARCKGIKRPYLLSLPNKGSFLLFYPHSPSVYIWHKQRSLATKLGVKCRPFTILTLLAKTYPSLSTTSSKDGKLVSVYRKRFNIQQMMGFPWRKYRYKIQYLGFSLKHVSVLLFFTLTLWLLLSLVLLSSALCLCVETRNIAARSNKIYFTHGTGNVLYCPQWPG